MDKIVITESSKETQKLAEELSLNSDNRFFALFGNLGSGKTTFSQGFAKGLGIKERIISPTFIIIRNYELRIMNKGFDSFYHVDLYRVQSKSDIESLGLEEIFNDEKNIIIVEWAEKIKNILPKKRTEIYFENLDVNKRKITFKNYE